MEKVVKTAEAGNSRTEIITAILLYMLILFVTFSTVFLGNKSLYPITYAGRSTDYLIRNASVIKYIDAGGIYTDNGAADWVEIPIMSAAYTSIHNGEMPLWNIFNSFGMPIIDNNNGSTLAPLAFLLYFNNSEMAWNIMYIIRIFVIMLFTYMFIKELGLKFSIAFTGGVVFGLSGYVMLYLNIFFMHVDAFLPLLMWMTLCYVNTGKIKYWIGSSLTVAAMCLGGNPQNLITCCLLAYAFFIFKTFTSPNCLNKLKTITIYTCCFISGIILTLGYWFSFLTLYLNCYSYHVNSGLRVKTIQEIFGIILPVENFISTARGNWMPYLGIVPISAIIIHLEFGKDKKYHKEKLFFLTFVIVFILKIIGFPLINWIGKLPVLNELLFTKYNSSIYFALVVLVAFALNDLQTNKCNKRKWIQCVFIILIAIGTNITFYSKIFESNELLNRYLKVISFVLIFAAIITVMCTIISKTFYLLLMEILLCIEMISYPLNNKNLLIPKGEAFGYPEFIMELKNLQENDYDRVFCVDRLLMGNLSAIYKVCNVGGISATPEIHYWNFMNELILQHNIDLQIVTTQSSTYYPTSKKYLDMIGAKFFMVDNNQKIEDPSLIPVYEKKGLTIYRNDNSFEKAYTVHDVVQVTNEEEALAVMKEETFDFSQSAVVEGNLIYTLSDTTNEKNDVVTIDEYQANSVSIRCAMSTDGLLILNDLYYPGWSVYVNGKKQEILRTNDVMRGVYLSQGNNNVKFVYRPKAFIMGSAISIIYVAAFIVGINIFKRENKT